MATEQTEIAVTDLAIVPLSEIKTREHFKFDEKSHNNLINWFHTRAVISERERTCKTFVALSDGVVIGYIAISTNLLDSDIEGMKSSNKFKPQILTIGKLYVSPEYRRKGIGEQLTQYAIGIAKVIDDMTGCIGVFVDSNQSAVEFYKRVGFTVLEKPGLLSLDRTVVMYLRIPDRVIT